MITQINETLKIAVENGDVSGANVLVLHNGRGNLMRVCDDESMTSLFSSKGEYGWDGWLGTFFSNEPAHGITLLFGTQQAGVGRSGVLVRKIKNIVMSSLA